MIRSFLNEARNWCAGRHWPLRLALLVYFAWILVNHLRDPDYSSWFGGLNLGIHELGHFVFAPFGRTMGIAGGTFLQCLAPLISIGMFWRQEDYFGFAFSFGWLSTNLFNVARYVGDAVAMELPLVSPFAGDEVIHDWNYLLEEMHLIQYDLKIAAGIRVAAIVCMLAGLAWGGWIVANMIRQPPKNTTPA
jgi:hypothetical protein